LINCIPFQVSELMAAANWVVVSITSGEPSTVALIVVLPGPSANTFPAKSLSQKGIALGMVA
jgi:hypothetical protein